jgi:hypothetical protein
MSLSLLILFNISTGVTSWVSKILRDPEVGTQSLVSKGPASLGTSGKSQRGLHLSDGSKSSKSKHLEWVGEGKVK